MMQDSRFALLQQTGEPSFLAEMYRVRGELPIRGQSSDLAAAENALVRVVEIARNQRTRTFALRAAFSLARLYQVTGREGYELLASAVPISLKDPVFLRLPKPPFARIAWTRRQPLSRARAGALRVHSAASARI